MQLSALGRSMRQDRRAVAALEFALTLPIMMPIALYGIEFANLSVTQMRLSQIALTLADNASRVGVDTTLNQQDLREYDVNEVFQGARLQAGMLQDGTIKGTGLDLGNQARITLSSLETNAQGGQWIHWQRCLGVKSGTGWDSTYGAAGDGASGTSLAGMGDPGAQVKAPANAGVMFVELNYQYKPLISTVLVGTPRIHLIASFIVRDNRSFTKSVTNPSPQSVPMLCSLHNA